MLIVDYSHLFYRHIFANKDNLIDNQNLLAHLLVNSLYNITDKFKIDRDNPLVVALDCHKRNNWRTKFYLENSKQFPEYDGMTYKGHRKLDATIPWDKIYSVINDVTELLRNSTDVIVIQHENAEADDIIAVGTEICKERKEKCIIITEDKDMIQLIGPYVSLYKPIKNEMWEFC